MSLMLPILYSRNMVLIISQDNDYSTLEVIKWLKHFKVKYIRINSDDQVHIQEWDLQKKSFIFKIEDASVNLDSISYIWYRRGKLSFTLSSVVPEINEFLKRETFSINEYLFSSQLFSEKNAIGNWLLSEPNKLLVLELARQVGLRIPNTYITGSKDQALSYLENDIEYISKGIGSNLMFQDNENIYAVYTETFTKKDLSNYKEDFFPSLIQERIPKAFEIRAFILEEEIFSMAIFSQKNQQTAVDFRKYDLVLPNRTVPFNLPSAIENKLKLLLKKLELNSASADLILSEDGEYVFLEVNPVGQFGMVSSPCNYYLEKLIAKKLSAYEHSN